jgi:hypothetical protein
MSLADAIAEALANATPAPPNEAATCSWVIEPLLKAIGYALREIEPRVRDSNSQFPDYAILPGTPATWYLEAKCWDAPLEDRHAQQALNYANQNGRRWVVLTNGQLWRLYDNQIQGTAPDKLVAEATLDDLASSERFLQAISRESVTTGNLARFARLFRLAGVLGLQLRDQNSPAVRALWSNLRRQPGLEALTRADITEYLMILGAAMPPAAPPPAPPDAADIPDEEIREPAPQPPVTGDVASLPAQLVPAAKRAKSAGEDETGGEWQPLRAVEASGTMGFKPISLRLPNGEVVPVRSWSQLLAQACKYVLAANPGLPVPLADRSGKRVSLISPVRPPSNLRSEPAAVSDSTVFVYVNYDADNCVANALHVLNYTPTNGANVEPAVLIRRRKDS